VEPPTVFKFSTVTVAVALGLSCCVWREVFGKRGGVKGELPPVFYKCRSGSCMELPPVFYKCRSGSVYSPKKKGSL